MHPNPVGETLLFPAPMLSFALPDAPALNGQLMKEVEARRATEPGIQRSNRGGWHSLDDFFHRTEPGHRALASAVVEAVRVATLRFQPDAKLDELTLEAEGWINVNPKGTLNAPHDHPGWLWSGSYYIQTPTMAGSDITQGCIEFLDSRTNLRVVSIVDLPFMRAKAQLRPAPGLLLFPSHLLHWVYPHDANDERVSVAFNARWRAGSPTLIRPEILSTRTGLSPLRRAQIWSAAPAHQDP